MSLKNTIVREIKKYLAKDKPCILIYHGVVKSELNIPAWTFMIETTFEEQMRLLSDNFNCISLSNLVKDIKNKTIKPRSVAITFDDGFENNYSVAFPILKKYNLPATIFLTAGYIGTNNLLWPDKLLTILEICDNYLYFDDQNLLVDTVTNKQLAFQAIAKKLKILHPYKIESNLQQLIKNNNIDYPDRIKPESFNALRMMSWSQAREMLDSKLVEFGSHTINHTILSRLSEKEAYKEIVESKNIIEDHLGPIDLFAYPNGQQNDFTSINRQQIIDAGYRGILTGITRVVKPTSNVYDLDRIGIGPNLSNEDFLFFLNGGIAYLGGFPVINKIRSYLK